MKIALPSRRATPRPSWSRDSTVSVSKMPAAAELGPSHTAKHACVAARIGDDAKRGAANMSILASRATKSAPVLAATPCGLARVLAHGFVPSPLLSRSKRRALLLALSQNRDSASRVLPCGKVQSAARAVVQF